MDNGEFELRVMELHYVFTFAVLGSYTRGLDDVDLWSAHTVSARRKEVVVRMIDLCMELLALLLLQQTVIAMT